MGGKKKEHNLTLISSTEFQMEMWTSTILEGLHFRYMSAGPSGTQTPQMLKVHVCGQQAPSWGGDGEITHFSPCIAYSFHKLRYLSHA